MAESKKSEPKTDSEGLKVASIHDEVLVEEEPKKSAAKEAFEAEVAKDEAEVAADQAAHDEQVTKEFNEFLAGR